MESIAAKIGCTAETLRKWVRRAERDSGQRAGLMKPERDGLKALERENREPQRSNEIVCKAAAFFSYANRVHIHHSDRGCHYLSIRYTERLAQADIDASVGSVGDSYDNAFAETFIGLDKTEVIHARGSWRTLDAVEYATLRPWRPDSTTGASGIPGAVHGGTAPQGRHRHTP